MIERFNQGDLCWIRMEKPTSDEVHEIMAEFLVPPSLMSDLTMEVPRSGAILDGDFIKVTMNFPIVKRKDINHPHEVKFIIAQNLLITAQYEDMEAMDRFRKEFEVLSTLSKAAEEVTGADLFTALIIEFYTVIDFKLDYITSKLADIESQIFAGREKEMVFALSEMSKNMIIFRQTIKSHDGILRDIRPLVDVLFGNVLENEYKSIHGHYFIILRRIDSLFETLDGLRDTNMALLTTKQNEIMKLLTIMAFIMYPLTLISSMFGMNTRNTPIVGYHSDFWIIVGIMLVSTVFFFIFFKYKKWI